MNTPGVVQVRAWSLTRLLLRLVPNTPHETTRSPPRAHGYSLPYIQTEPEPRGAEIPLRGTEGRVLRVLQRPTKRKSTGVEFVKASRFTEPIPASWLVDIGDRRPGSPGRTATVGEALVPSNAAMPNPTQPLVRHTHRGEHYLRRNGIREDRLLAHRNDIRSQQVSEGGTKNL